MGFVHQQWVGTIVAACGREWRFQSYSKLVQRSLIGASLCFGHTETACSHTTLSSVEAYHPVGLNKTISLCNNKLFIFLS